MEELKSWIHDGRVGGTTNVWRSDVGTWLPAAQYFELQFDLGIQVQPAAAVLYQPVSFWPRFAAYILDNVILSIASVAIWSVAVKFLGWAPLPVLPATPTMEDVQKLMLLLGPLQAIYIFLRMIYDVYFVGRFQATPGKMVIGARIVRLDGSPLGYGFAFFRFLGTVLSDITYCIGYLLVAFRQDKRALHDLVVGTRVIFKR